LVVDIFVLDTSQPLFSKWHHEVFDHSRTI